VLTDAELLCLVVAQRCSVWPANAAGVRYARKNLADLFRYLPNQSGYGKRVRGQGRLISAVIVELARGLLA